MRQILITLAAALAIVLGAAPAASAHGVGPAGVSVHEAPFDQQFIDMMAAHHMMATEMARMALERSNRAEVKAIARKMIAAQSQEIADFRKLRRQWYGSARFREYPMDQMMMRSMGMGPNSMKGLMMSKRFDYAFLSAMIAHHSGANTTARWQTQEGTKLVLKRMAKKIIRDQAGEIGEMIAMRKAWYGR